MQDIRFNVLIYPGLRLKKSCRFLILSVDRFLIILLKDKVNSFIIVDYVCFYEIFCAVLLTSYNTVKRKLQCKIYLYFHSYVFDLQFYS